jgi:hypothetical protein
MDPLNLGMLEGVGFGVGALVIRTVVVVVVRRWGVGQRTDGDSARRSIVLWTIVLVRISVGCPVAVALTVAFFDLPQQRADSLDDEERPTDYCRDGPHGSVSARGLVVVG